MFPRWATFGGLAVLLCIVAVGAWFVFPKVVNDSASQLAVHDGTYVGKGQQSGSQGQKTWQLRLTFTGARGTISYARSGQKATCLATLAQHETGNWTESITYGQCDTGGTWTFTAHDEGRLHGQYTSPGGRDYTVEADLNRE